jgi:hypothetical protein
MPRLRVPALLLVAVLALGAALVGCEPDVEEEAAPEEPTSLGGEDVQEGVMFTRVDRSPALSGAAARFTDPAENGANVTSPVSVTVEVESFEAGAQTTTPRRDSLANSANGQHVHIIVDNEPYLANYDPGAPFDVGDLEPGAHSAIVFPSRSYHESVKNEGAMDYVNFYVGDGPAAGEEEGVFPFDPEQPTIIYSRPKGTYEGEAAENILLDFYLHNVQLSEDGYTARYTIRQLGQIEGNTMDMGSIVLADWQPVIVEGLPSGDYVVELVLLDPQGAIVNGLFNQTEREITVLRTEDMGQGESM